MHARLSTTRFAVAMGTILALLVAGAVAGAAGSALILGLANSAGTSNTSLTTATNSGTALLVTQNGTATALRGSATNGIAGFFTSAAGSGVSGVVANLNNYGVYAANDSDSTGIGAALRAAGQKNYAVVATSDDKAPIKVIGPIGMAPFEVNSSVTVTNLNADLLDGLNSTQLARTDQSQHYSCVANDMAPLLSTTAYSGGVGARFVTSGDDWLSCAVHLPDGATVTGFAADVYDDTASYQTDCALFRGTVDTTAETMANTESGVAATPGFTPLIDATIDTPVIDNATYAYTAACYLHGAALADLQAVKVTVTYTGAP